MNKTDFSMYEKRVLGLLSEGDESTPERVALRKIVDFFPLIVQVTECNFDKKVSAHAVAVQMATLNFKIVYDEYFENRHKDEK